MQESKYKDDEKKTNVYSPSPAYSWIEEGICLIWANEFDRAIAFLQERIDSAEGKEDRAALLQRAEAFFLLSYCYDTMFLEEKLEYFSEKARQAVSCLGLESDFIFQPLLECNEISSEEEVSGEELLPSMNSFIEKNKDSPLSYVYRDYRFFTLLGLGRLQEANEDFLFLSELYPNAIKTLLSGAMLSVEEHDLIGTLECFDRIENLIPESSGLMEIKGLLFYRLEMFGAAEEILLSSLSIKASTNKTVYEALLTFSMQGEKAREGSVFQCLDPYIKDVPWIILEVVEDGFSMLEEDFTQENATYGDASTVSCQRNIFLFFLGRYAGLCLFELGHFQEAENAFRLAARATFCSQFEEIFLPEVEGLFVKLKAECESKIAECQYEVLRRKKAVKKIYFTLMEAMYRPGGPGYHAAQERFNQRSAIFLSAQR